VLQCVAVGCSALQCVAVCCSVFQCDAVCCSVLQCVVVCCSVLQCVAVCCSVLQCVVVCCSVLQASFLGLFYMIYVSVDTRMNTIPTKKTHTHINNIEETPPKWQKMTSFRGAMGQHGQAGSRRGQ